MTLASNSSHRTSRTSSFVAVLVLAIANPRDVLAMQQLAKPAEVIGGIVRSPSGPLVDASVVLTMAPDRASQRGVTDSAGRFIFRVMPGRGDYLLYASAPGYGARRLRVTMTGDTLRDVTLTLSPAAATLAAVTVRAAAASVPPRGSGDLEVGGGERFAEGIVGAVTPDESGDVVALAATHPTVVATPGGISVMGLSATHSSVTLNGAAFPGGELPRTAEVRTRVTSSTFDPSRGGFSSGQLSIELSPGGVYSHRRAWAAFDAPPAQGGDRVARALGHRASALRLSLGGDGAMRNDRVFYNGAIEAYVRDAPTSSILTAHPDVLRAFGVDSAGAARFVQAVGDAGADDPMGRPNERNRTAMMIVLGRLDRPIKPDGALALTVYARDMRSGHVGAGPLVSSGRTEVARATAMGATAAYGSVLAKRVRRETRLTFSSQASRSAPVLAAPGADVLLEGGAQALTSLSFGGAGRGTVSRRAWVWEAADESQWHVRGESHRLKLSAMIRLDGSTTAGGAATRGHFSYASLNELSANLPSTFTRALTSPHSGASTTYAALAIGDYWRVGSRAQLLYGVRLDYDLPRSGTVLATNVEGRFGARPAIALSPRVGFNLQLGRSSSAAAATAGNSLGRFSAMQSGVLRGGVGRFRGTFAQIASVGVGGIESGEYSLVRCVGADVPQPDWGELLAGVEPPRECAGRAGGDALPSQYALDAGARPPSSWRGNLAWSGGIGGWEYSVEGIASLNVDLPSIHDANLAAAPFTVLALEGARALFVPPSLVDTASGGVALRPSRQHEGTGTLAVLESAGRSSSRQLTLSLRQTPTPMSRSTLGFAYTLSSFRARAHGLDAPAFGDPREWQWAPGEFDVRHRMVVSVGLASRTGIVGTIFMRAASGAPYTPLVIGDVNGDGVAGDRAFVPGPNASDSALARDIDALLSAAPRAARACLASQRGRAAGVNSCRGPWTQGLNARIGFPGRLLRAGDRTSVGLTIANALGGIDQLLHGRDELRGWGSAPSPDPALLVVRGFDPSASAFRYAVNPRFGDVRRSAAAQRRPFRVTVDVSIDLGTPLPVQTLNRALGAGRNGRPGVRQSTAEVKRRYARTVPNLAALVLSEADSLLLTREQFDTLTAAASRFRLRADSLWTPLAEYLSGLPDSYDGERALARTEAVTDQVWELARAESAELRRVLTPVQIRMLPGLVLFVMNTKGKIKLRFNFAS